MAVLIVDALEVVDIEHDQRQRARHTVEPEHFALEAILEIAAVIDPCQRVGDGQRTQFFLDPFEIRNIRDITVPKRTASRQLFRRRFAANPAQASLG